MFWGQLQFRAACTGDTKNKKKKRFTRRFVLYSVTQKGRNAIRACVGDSCNSVRACTADKKTNKRKTEENKENKHKTKETTHNKQTRKEHAHKQPKTKDKQNGHKKKTKKETKNKKWIYKSI